MARPVVSGEQTRKALRRGEAIGRDGQIITRHRDMDGSPLDIPEEYMDAEWDRQWVRFDNIGKPDAVNVSRAIKGGWRPVQQRQMPGYLGSIDSDEAIEYEGLRLYERPMKLSEEAKEDTAAQNYRNERAYFDKFRLQLPDGLKERGKSITKSRPEVVPNSLKPSYKHASAEIPD